jgi:hypothetical protein
MQGRAHLRVSQNDSPSQTVFLGQLVKQQAFVPTLVLAERAETMTNAHLKLVTAAVKRTVTPRRPPNGDIRTREYLTEAEVEKLMNAARGNRYGHRDATMGLVAYWHGLRAAELVDN